MSAENTKQKIMIEALKLFSQYGYEAVSVDQIAKAVGIKAPSLYKHYKSKQNIFDSILAKMEQLDEERAKEFDVPEGTIEQMPEKYKTTQIHQAIAFSNAQFIYWTEDEFASCFRKMLILEQFRNEEMSRLYHQYICSAPLDYVSDLLFSLGFADYRELAVEFFAPMFLLYSIYDGSTNKEEIKKLLKNHFEKMRFRLESESKN